MLLFQLLYFPSIPFHLLQLENSYMPFKAPFICPPLLVTIPPEGEDILLPQFLSYLYG